MPRLAHIGQFMNFLRFFQAKSAFNLTAMTSSMMSSNQVYFQINSKFDMNGTVPEFVTVSKFSMIFSSKIRRPARLP
jgi:hypothetical protein